MKRLLTFGIVLSTLLLIAFWNHTAALPPDQPGPSNTIGSAESRKGVSKHSGGSRPVGGTPGWGMEIAMNASIGNPTLSTGPTTPATPRNEIA